MFSTLMAGLAAVHQRRLTPRHLMCTRHVTSFSRLRLMIHFIFRHDYVAFDALMR